MIVIHLIDEEPPWTSLTQYANVERRPPLEGLFTLRSHYMAANYKPLTIDSLCHIFPAISRDKIERIMLCTQRHGINRRAISRETGIDVSLVFKVLKKSGVRTLHRHHHLDASVVLRMHGAGATDHQIAEYLRVPGPSVTTKRHRLKLCANVAARRPVLCVSVRHPRILRGLPLLGQC